MANKLNPANILTFSRVLFLPLLYLFVLLDLRIAFLIAFILIGSTDAFDGYIARKFNYVSDLGKMLDSLADIFFYISIVWFLYELFPHVLDANLIILGIAFIVYFASFLVSLIKCGKPIMMHTTLLRFNAVNVYLMVILSFFMDTSLYLTIILIIFMIGFIEEIIIFIKFGQVNPDTKSIFSLINEQK
jgi:phosphatidylglycerophosphate synthase